MLEFLKYHCFLLQHPDNTVKSCVTHKVQWLEFCDTFVTKNFELQKQACGSWLCDKFLSVWN